MVSLAGREVIESDQCPACEACVFCETTGHYGLGNWVECLGWGLLGGWTTECARAQEFSSAGAFGYWPGIDTARDYYFQLAMQGPGAVVAAAMKAVVKPVIDAVLDGDTALVHKLVLEATATVHRPINKTKWVNISGI